MAAGKEGIERVALAPRRRTLGPAVFGLGIGLLACTAPDPTRVPHQAGPEEIVRIDGGLWFGQPEWVLLGDGRLYSFTWEIMADGAPALPDVTERRLTEAGIQAVLGELRSTGLFEKSADFGAIAGEVSRYRYEVNAGGPSVRVAIDNLDDPAAHDLLHLVPEAEREAFRQLEELRLRLHAIEQHLDAADWVQRQQRPYRPHAVAAFVERRGDDPWPGEQPWPVGRALGDYRSWGGRGGVVCGIVAGDDLDRLLVALTGVSRLDSYWVDLDGIARYAVEFRSLLPSEPATCDR